MFNSILRYGILSQAVSGATPSFPTSGLTSYWRFDEQGGTIAYDALGNRNMTATAGATVSTSGISENCRDFDGSTGKLYTANDVFSNAEVVSGSISAWFKSSTQPSGEDAVIFSIEAWASIFLQDGTGYIRVNSDGTNYTNGSVDLTDGVWHHIVFTWNASGNMHYIDGGTGVSGTATKSPTPDTTSGRATTIGRLFQDSREFTGLIDEVGVWSNRELSQEEVTALYNSGAGLFY